MGFYELLIIKVVLTALVFILLVLWLTDLDDDDPHDGGLYGA